MADGVRGAPTVEPAENTRARGLQAEAIAAEYLRRRGLEVLGMNVICGGAELDLIARDDRCEPTVVFVEVRSRGADELGHPLETIGAQKRRRLVHGATAWLVGAGLWERVAARFDVVTLVRPSTPQQEILWLPAAFGP